MRYSLFIAMSVLLLASCREPIASQAEPKAQVVTERGIGAITWRHIGLHHNDELTLRPDGTYTLLERGTYHRNDGLSASSTARPISYTETCTSTGRWRPIMSDILLLVKDKSGQMPGWNGYVRVFRRGDLYGFGTVASRESQINSDDNPIDWLELSNRRFIYLRDMAHYSDEQDISGLLGVKPYTPSTEVPSELTAKVRAQLPKGWSTTETGNALIVARDEPIQLVSRINMPGHAMGDPEPDHFNETVDRHYAIILRFGELYTPEQVRGLQAANTALDRRLDEMRNAMHDINHKFDSYLPSTDEQKRCVEAYKQAKASRKSVPNYHTQKNAVFVTDSVGWTETITSRKQEIAEVKQKVLGVLQAY